MAVKSKNDCLLGAEDKKEILNAVKRTLLRNFADNYKDQINDVVVDEFAHAFDVLKPEVRKMVVAEIKKQLPNIVKGFVNDVCLSFD